MGVRNYQPHIYIYATIYWYDSGKRDILILWLLNVNLHVGMSIQRCRSFSNSIFLIIFIHGSYKKVKKNTNETNTIEFILHRKLYEIGEKNVGMKNIKKLFFHKNNNIKKSKKKKDERWGETIIKLSKKSQLNHQLSYFLDQYIECVCFSISFHSNVVCKRKDSVILLYWMTLRWWFWW